MSKKKSVTFESPYWCGPVIDPRDWRSLPISELTRAERNMAFCEKYLRVPEGGKVGQKLRFDEFQERFFYSVYDNPVPTRRAYLSMARKNGKALSLDTKIPTPSGWTTMGDVKTGDVIYDEKGDPCNVTFATGVQLNRNCYWVSFADGSKILADADHQWTVYSRRRKGEKITLTTADMADDVVLPYSRLSHVERNYSVDVAGPIKTSPKKLLVKPYTLGVWLGDGSSKSAAFYVSDDDAKTIVNEVRADGYPVIKTNEKFKWSITDGVSNRAKDCLAKDLRSVGVMHNKHIPSVYLRSSIAQRLELLQGLMDTDGFVSKAGQCEFTGSNKPLCDGVLELVRSLGFKATMTESDSTLYGRVVGKRWRVTFVAYADTKVFRLDRKQDRLKARPIRSRNSRNYIVGIEATDSVPVKCIQVDSESSLFLAGEGFTPTHNTGTIACINLVHIIGPEAVQNSRIQSGALSREQASEVFNYASKMIMLSPEIKGLVRIIDSSRTIIGLPLNVTYKAIAAEAKTTMGGSPIVAILDETGQIKGPQDDFVDAVETSQGAYENPLLIAISTQSAEDSDLFSVWLDDAKNSKDPSIIAHVYTAPKGCDLLDERAWKAANPALDSFRSRSDLEGIMTKAARMPSAANAARNLNLNQRVSTVSPFVSRDVWEANGGYLDLTEAEEVYGGLDLSARKDLTALVLAGQVGDKWGLQTFFWTPEVGLMDRAKADRMPYLEWVQAGYLRTTPGATVDYGYIVRELEEILCDYPNLKVIAFDRWRIDIFKKELEAIDLELPLTGFGQGYKDMSPAIDEIESLFLNNRLAHGNNPVMTMCAANAVITKDPAGNRKLDKHKATGRMDGMVAATMAIGAAPRDIEGSEKMDITELFSR